ncbi:hypothetical protein CF394_13620 [Tetzosporium hominis]|uniref:Thioredoxin domain-containing protein n=1 Tax=Tetzosporium hominis TaxID=2020506 RepID=A0A264W0B4_9BACL|nr:thioredoxin family protein [Tetzosporium hominis]OZS76985.1 hypothetical protein CF394_13620 [Tetzosporium hominis]
MKEITYTEWQERRYSLLYIYTPMCGTCQVASKMLSVCEQLIDEEIPQINANYAPELMHEHQIESVPCLLIQKGEEPIEKIYAFQSVPYLLEKIKNYYRN